MTVSNAAVLRPLERKVGCTFTAVRWFQDWNEPFRAASARALAGSGHQLELSWQPQVRRAGRLTGVPYRDIRAGRHDPYVRQFARDIRRLNRTVTITFAPEMNGNWGAYQLGPANTPADFRAAFQHLVNVFRQERAPVRWVWAPNIQFVGMTASYAALYPGDSFVSEVGLDGYNWGTVHPWNRWRSFAQTFGPSYQAVKRLTRKPIQLGELSSAEQGGNKAQWILQLCRDLPAHARIRKVFWFHIHDGTVDWRLTTSDAALAAFRRCVHR